MVDFYNLRVGDRVEIKKVVHTIRGKSLGRDWRAIRTNHGLIHVYKEETFNVLSSSNPNTTANNESDDGYEYAPA
jgi:hypothetical protein